MLIDGDRVVLIATMAGTHAGDFFGHDGHGPPGRGRRSPCSCPSRDGLVVEERRIYDFTGLLVQVGVLKAKPSA